MLQDASERRVAAGERAQAQCEGALAQHHLRVEEARKARDQARAQHRWWAWLRCVVALRRERRGGPGPLAGAEAASHREKILKAGIRGEDMGAARLGGGLGADRTLFRRYPNRPRETDPRLLGPQRLV